MDSPPLEKVIESRLGADIYQEKSMIDEFLHGSGDRVVSPIIVI